MSTKALPIMFINLSGEMMYILDQRLRAQNISKEKSLKVVNDIVTTMFNNQFVEELFKRQELYSKQAMRNLFERLVHSSIMRLNETSMDKLYDLMTMVFKYQVFMCSRPEDLLFITLNHLDGIRMYTEELPGATKLVDNVYSLLLKHYAQLSAADYQFLRYTLLNYFQDLHVRVSVLLKKGYQLPNGSFVMPVNKSASHGSSSCSIRYYDKDSQVIKTEKFDVEPENGDFGSPGILEKFGERGTDLGKNIYLDDETAHDKSDNSRKSTEVITDTSTSHMESKEKLKSCEELSLLSSLIGRNNASCQPAEFTLSIFGDEIEALSSNEDRESKTLQAHNTIVNISIPQCTEKDKLHKIMDDLTVEAKDDDSNDILDLLDSASS